MKGSVKDRILTVINRVVPLADYDGNDYIFAQKSGITSVDMVYILQGLAAEFGFSINDELVDSLEACTFSRLEQIVLGSTVG